ncbi:MAG: Vms1/Ankzf1 family peptidyl-tRNA hydrolase [Solirubrobacterales bacterium]
MSPTLELHEIEPAELRQLERLGDGERPVLSVYFSLDLPEVPTERNREAELDSRLTETEERLAAEAHDGELGALRECVARVRAELPGAIDEAAPPRGIAFFCEAGGEMRAYALRRHPEFAVAGGFRAGPALEPLIEAMPGPTWGVAALSRKHGRVFRGTDTGLAEIGQVDDDVHRRHSQGGWSQARYQRGIEKETRDHVERVADLLFSLYERRPFERLALLAPPELLPVAEQALHPYLRERLGAQVAVDIDQAGADEVLAHLTEPIEEWRTRRVREALERLAQLLGEGDGAVAGAEGVRSALGQKRVEALLIGKGSRDEETEGAVEAAISQAAAVIVVGDDSLDPYGGVAAILRY